MAKSDKIKALDTEITVMHGNYDSDYISMTDIANFKNADYSSEVIQNWMRNRSTVEYLGLWERIHNPDFNYLAFEVIENEAGRNSFVLTPKRWIESVNAIGMTAKAGRYASTFAHKDIAFKFAAWISVELELYVIKDYQRLKTEESNKISLEWNLQRTISKINYRIHTDAIKAEIIPKVITKEQANFVYASEADLLNVALFGKTASEWRKENPEVKGNIRDYATLTQLVVLSNMESINALLIRQGLSQSQRLIQLNATAITQIESLTKSVAIKALN
ncbi:MAG: KilA-N domain-containing protein [Candidatus Cloacimonetes bacterium]|nr:KilA-N domain-containing protein [Candidatus Cloacimonadota bacterium]